MIRKRAKNFRVRFQTGAGRVRDDATAKRKKKKHATKWPKAKPAPICRNCGKAAKKGTGMCRPCKAASSQANVGDEQVQPTKDGESGWTKTKDETEWKDGTR